APGPSDAPPVGGGSPGVSNGGGGTVGGGSPAAPVATGELLLADGTRIVVPVAGEVALPPGASGEATLIMPGRVPSTIDLPAGGPTPALHPRTDVVPALPSGSARVVGSVFPPGDPDVAVQFISGTRGPQPGTTTVIGGAYAMSVALDGTEAGLLVAREATEYPRLGLARLTLTAGANPNVPNLGLVDPDPTPVAPPAAPAGYDITAARLLVAEGSGADVHRVQVVSVPGARLPSYDLPGFTFVAAFLASAADGNSATETSGSVGALPPFMLPPDLGALARPTPGTRLSWGAAPGASLYTVRVGRDLSPDPPLWEAATQGLGATVPAGLALAGQDLLVQVDAWDAPEVNVYSVASVRRLRLPAEPPGPRGRHSVALKRFTP
ncbi:MAG: hypothetical protein JWM80_1699, partial [Cyanobacteria bacterium RYN_339]|nr:hypothetical protein [Cyanobacteria bacterium RYN_339]